jgi:hypothetical protein
VVVVELNCDGGGFEIECLRLCARILSTSSHHTQYFNLGNSYENTREMRVTYLFLFKLAFPSFFKQKPIHHLLLHFSLSRILPKKCLCLTKETPPTRNVGAGLHQKNKGKTLLLFYLLVIYTHPPMTITFWGKSLHSFSQILSPFFQPLHLFFFFISQSHYWE